MRALAVLVLVANCAATGHPDLEAERDRLAADVAQAKSRLARYRVRLDMPPAGAHETLAAEVERLREELRICRLWLDLYRVPGPAERPTGVVTEVSPGRDRVKVSIGRRDGVRPGDELRVRRGDTYVGMLRIESVSGDVSVAVFDADHPGPGAPPQRADNVYPAYPRAR